MPTPGLSLLGFMEPPHAINYMRANCIVPDPTHAALIAEWTAAKGRLGAPFSDAGHPDIQPIPSKDQAYVQQLQQELWVQQGLAQYPGATFQVVEIDPLLAFQFHVLTDHSDGHCTNLRLGPTIAELLPICLPQSPPQEGLRISGQVFPPQAGAFVIAADSLNVRIVEHGLFQAENKVGIRFGISLPFVHVARYNGRCYLMNGFHRVFGARVRGAGRVPCLFREASSYEDAGVRSDGSTFSTGLLESGDAPTIGHFTQRRAHPVAIRRMSRVLQINWSEHALPLE